ncbi:MAG: Outer membrane protein assembly factor BamA [Chlamydiae bacterium]|nr:Outer membrane protein assembly factor BamA [Chlamydiota bacterium]
MNNKLLLCISLALATGITAKIPAQEQFEVPSYEDRRVGQLDIKIENLPRGSSFDRKSVLSKLRTRPGDPFSQYIFDQDLKQLAEDYDRVVPQIEVKGNQVDITLKVWLRPVIRSIEWSGNEYFKTKTLRKELDIKPGTVFNRSEFNRSFNKLKEYYIKKGYFESQITYKIVPVPNSQEIDIEIDIKEGRSGKVDKILFNGFTKKEESGIIERLYTKKYSNLTSWFTGVGKFNEEALEQDRLTIFNYLQDEGYADARVDIQILESPAKGKIIIDISADKGPLYHFGRVSFDGNILFSDEKIERLFRVHPDTVYSPEQLRKTADNIKELYGRKGHIDTSVTYETQLAQDEPVYNVHFQINEGREFRIGMIRVIGNIQTEARVILRESLLVPGEKFDSRKLQGTQMRLEQIGYFKSVNVYAVRTQDDISLGDNYRDIYIEVEETQTGHISLFSGFSSADNIFGGVDLTERNFNIQGLGRVWEDGFSSFRGGGEYFQMRTSFGPVQQNILVNWMTPYVNDTRWQLGIEFNAIIDSSLQSKNYSLNTYNLNTTLSYPLNPYWTTSFLYRARALDDRVKDSKKITEHTNNSGFLSGVGASIVFNTTNSAIKPNRGLRSFLEGEVVGVGGGYNFFRTAFLNAYYIPLSERGYMRYRCDFRFLFPFGKTNEFSQIPLSERYFLGGVASVRGYKEAIIGPRLKKKEKGKIKAIDRDPSGGISSSLLSMEYIYEAFSFLDTFVFIDGGYISDEVFGFGTYRFSYGAGVNVSVLGQMPITLGYGVPINARKRQKEHFFFSLGGQF